MDKLRECPNPWCEHDKLQKHRLIICGVVHHWVKCDACGMQSPIRPTKPEAIAAWNTRNDGWLPIETAPKDGTTVIGYDAVTAEQFSDPNAGTCLITWVESWDDGEDVYPAEWQVQPFCEGLDCVESETRLTRWQPLPTPPSEDQ